MAARVGVTGFPTLQLFHKGRVFHFAGKARDAAVLVDFVRAGFLKFGHQEFAADAGGRLTLRPKPQFWRAVDWLRGFLALMFTDVQAAGHFHNPSLFINILCFPRLTLIEPRPSSEALAR